MLGCFLHIAIAHLFIRANPHYLKAMHYLFLWEFKKFSLSAHYFVTLLMIGHSHSNYLSYLQIQLIKTHLRLINRFIYQYYFFIKNLFSLTWLIILIVAVITLCPLLLTILIISSAFLSQLSRLHTFRYN